MTRDTRYVSATVLYAACAAVLALSVSGAGRAASTVVYRCLDAHLGVVYTDVPCKDGAPLDVHTGEVDPAAVAKLERAREALDQSAAQRISDERRLAGQKELLAAQLPREAAESPNADGMYADGQYAYGLAGPVSARPHPRARHRAAQRDTPRGGAPNPPYIVPRL
jgi:hypothetical protein